MSVPVITFFNNKGGVGKTSMIYHLSYMFADHGLRVLAADLDPQCNLTAAFIDEERLEEVLRGNQRVRTIYGAVQPLKRGTGDIADPSLEEINDNLRLIAGDLALSSFEDHLAECWPKCLASDERAFRVMSAFWRVLQKAATNWADVVLIDLGPNLGATNRAALIASDFVVIPLSPDLFSLQGLENLGPALKTWRADWQERVPRNPASDLILPPGKIVPVGYMVLRHSIRLDRPVKAYEKWMARIPETYNRAVLDRPPAPDINIDNDNDCIAKLRDYRSLMPLAQEARKPMFFLKPADGAMGAHIHAVQDLYKDFLRLAKIIAGRTGLKLE
ncbi:MAG: AAA family ATPase [Candidatus Latescibacteria bacterium]|nr:AAA family ATPase [Candidatus Latescibacterota bacterium]